MTHTFAPLTCHLVETRKCVLSRRETIPVLSLPRRVMQYQDTQAMGPVTQAQPQPTATGPVGPVPEPAAGALAGLRPIAHIDLTVDENTTGVLAGQDRAVTVPRAVVDLTADTDAPMQPTQVVHSPATHVPAAMAAAVAAQAGQQPAAGGPGAGDAAAAAPAANTPMDIDANDASDWVDDPTFVPYVPAWPAPLTSVVELLVTQGPVEAPAYDSDSDADVSVVSPGDTDGYSGDSLSGSEDVTGDEWQYDDNLGAHDNDTNNLAADGDAMNGIMADVAAGVAARGEQGGQAGVAAGPALAAGAVAVAGGGGGGGGGAYGRQPRQMRLTDVWAPKPRSRRGRGVRNTAYDNFMMEFPPEFWKDLNMPMERDPRDAASGDEAGGDAGASGDDGAPRRAKRRTTGDGGGGSGARGAGGGGGGRRARGTHSPLSPTNETHGGGGGGSGGQRRRAGGAGTGTGTQAHGATSGSPAGRGGAGGDPAAAEARAEARAAARAARALAGTMPRMFTDGVQRGRGGEKKAKRARKSEATASRRGGGTHWARAEPLRLAPTYDLDPGPRHGRGWQSEVRSYASLSWCFALRRAH